MQKTAVFKNEMEWISDEKLKKFCETAVSGLPDYFFEVAASSTGKYHPAYALGNGGLVRHTKAAVTIAHELLQLEMFWKFTQTERDLILIALILHDGRKHGVEKSKFTVAEHPVLAADYIKEVNEKTSLLTEEQKRILAGLICSHMGQWNTDRYGNVLMPKPVTPMQKFVHLCDYLASRKYLLFDFGDHYYDPENYR